MRWILFLILLGPFSANGAPLPLSSTFQIQSRSVDLNWVYLQKFNAWRAETTWKGEKFYVTAIHTRPSVYANSFSVKDEWKSQTAKTPTRIKVLSDKGCARNGRVHFSCERLLNENHEALALEKLFWNEKSDLVVLRVTTLKNRSALQGFAKEIETQPLSRLPASREKGGRR